MFEEKLYGWEALGFDGSLPCEHGRQRRKCPICELVQAEEELEDLLAENAALRKRLADVMPLAEFGIWCIDEARGEFCGDIDGGSLQDRLEEAGLLGNVPVTEPCGENCACAEWDDFPQDCLRETDLARRARAAVKGEG